MIHSRIQRLLLLAVCLAALASAAPVYFDVSMSVDFAYTGQAGWVYIQFAPGTFDGGGNPDFVSASAAITTLPGGDTPLSPGPLLFGNASGDLTTSGAALTNADPTPDFENGFYQPLTFGSNLPLRVALSLGAGSFASESWLAFAFLNGADWNTALPIQTTDPLGFMGYLRIGGNGAVTPDPQPSGETDDGPLPSLLSFSRYTPPPIGQVPEPATAALLSAGLAALALLRRRS